MSEAQFARLELFLTTNTHGIPRVDDRQVISGIVHVLKSGCRWADVQAVYGPRKTLYDRFMRWADKGGVKDIRRATRKRCNADLQGSVGLEPPLWNHIR